MDDDDDDDDDVVWGTGLVAKNIIDATLDDAIFDIRLDDVFGTGLIAQDVVDVW